MPNMAEIKKVKEKEKLRKRKCAPSGRWSNIGFTEPYFSYFHYIYCSAVLRRLYNLEDMSGCQVVSFSTEQTVGTGICMTGHC